MVLRLSYSKIVTKCMPKGWSIGRESGAHNLRQTFFGMFLQYRE